MLITLPSLKGDTWFNSPPLNPQALKGQITLVYFWHYADSRAKTEIMELKKLWAKYNQFGLNIIGVHSPEYKFEAKANNLEKFLIENKVYWPVIMDSEFENWDPFDNKFWLSKYLSDKEGRVFFQTQKDGSFDRIERRLHELLQLDQSIEVRTQDKPKLQRQVFGYEQDSLSHQEGYLRSCIKDYNLPVPEILLINQAYLKGKFLAEQDHIESINANSELVLQINASQVNLVLEPVGEKCIITIFTNGRELSPNLSGSDVDNGILVSKLASLYQLLESDRPISTILKIRASEGAFKLYAIETRR